MQPVLNIILTKSTSQMTKPECWQEEQFQAPGRAEQGRGRGVNRLTRRRSIISLLRSSVRGSRLNTTHIFEFNIKKKLLEQLIPNHHHTLRVGPRPTGGSPVAAWRIQQTIISIRLVSCRSSNASSDGPGSSKRRSVMHSQSFIISFDSMSESTR